ncbi:hypothetical protein IQ230_05265 [Gloeocapsopsis crepidinum LEGE 06123]|uniref:DUF8173 domain-containing protein n=1 Tax=Gloeocapsopsis crepidinum LEGE 06123 TaxID=588587 RepID=A0ABR9UNC0_9CHRO|nr:hypothetical protein [Gloeocapsopsis crepidinum]MBE9189781.1 hypothetical protein [Gloeocapsopsis crepidinum LEGE 06123]
MQRKPLNRLVWMVVSALIAILISATVSAQTDININDRNLIRVGGDVIVPANQVIENAHAIGGDVTIEEGARVTQTAIAIGGDVILAENARVDGDAYAVGGDIVRAEGATIGGSSQIFTEQGRWGMRGSRRRGIDGFWFHYLSSVAAHLLTVLLSAVVGIFILRWRPNFLLNLAETVREYPVQCALWGLGGIVAVILLVILLAISLIGIPLLPLVGLSVAIVVLLGTLGVALWIGEKTRAKSEHTPVEKFLMGLLILGLIGLVPGLGGLILSVANLVGFGAVLTWLFNKRRPQLSR